MSLKLVFCTHVRAQPAAPLPGQENRLLLLLLGPQSAVPAGGAPPPVLELAPLPHRPGGSSTLGGLTALDLVREFMETVVLCVNKIVMLTKTIFCITYFF